MYIHMYTNEGDFLTFMECNGRTPSYIKRQGPLCSLGHYKYIGPKKQELPFL